MGDPELVRQLARAATGRTVCSHCACVLLDLLDAVRDSRSDTASERDAAAGAAGPDGAERTSP